MNKLALGALFVGLMACGGDDGNNPIILDGGGGTDGTVIGACNPLTQTGCNAGEKCTWFNDQDNPPVGHVGCAPEGTVAIGDACTEGPAGPMGYDDCATGGVCLSGICKTICDHQGGSPACPANYSCTRYADFFVAGGTTVAGVCDPSCDPLTQDLLVGDQAACGSADATMPNLGCYGYDDYSCAPTGMNSWALTDREEPQTNSAGNPYLNGCGPGFIPLFYETTGSMKALCTGFCAAQEVNNTTTNAAIAVKGDTAAVGKMPTKVKAAGDATCAIGKKGGHESSECKFLWPFLVDAMMIPEPFASGPYLDTLGVCMAVSQFNYDHDEVASTPNLTYPSCATLPPPTAATTGDDDDAGDWFCSKLSTLEALPFTSGAKSTVRNPVVNDVRVPAPGTLEIARHNLL